MYRYSNLTHRSNEKRLKELNKILIYVSYNGNNESLISRLYLLRALSCVEPTVNERKSE